MNAPGTRWLDRVRGTTGRTRDALALGALALAVRVSVVLLSGPYRPQSDAHQYLDIARNVAEGRGFGMQWPQLEVHPTAFRPPAWPTVLAGWIRVAGDDPSVARLLNVAIGVAVVVGVYLVVDSSAGRLAARVAAALCALYPPLVANDVTTLSESLAHLLLVGICSATVHRRHALLGLLLGAFTLTKPSGQVVALCLILLVLVMERRRGGAATPADAEDVASDADGRSVVRLVRDLGWRSAALAASVLLVVVVPWGIRNSVRVGTWQMVTSNGFNLAAVYGENARAARDFVDPVYDPLQQSLEERLLRFDEAKWSETLAERGLAGIREEPGYVLEVVARNLACWFELRPSKNQSAEILDGRNLRLRSVGLVLFYPVTVAGLAGLALRLRRGEAGRRMAAALVAVSVATLATSLPLVAPPRLRGLMDLACCVGVGLLVATWAERRRGAKDQPAENPSAKNLSAESPSARML